MKNNESKNKSKNKDKNKTAQSPFDDLYKQEFTAYAIFRPKDPYAIVTEAADSPLSAQQSSTKKSTQKTKKTKRTKQQAKETASPEEADAFAEKNDLVGLVLSESEVQEFVSTYLQKIHYEHFSLWCENHDLDIAEKDSWDEYVEVCLDEESPQNRFIVVDWLFSASSLAGILRTFFAVEPLGCSYETPTETQHYNQRVMSDLLAGAIPNEGDEEALSASLKEALNSPAGQRLISSLADALLGGPEEDTHFPDSEIKNKA